MAMTVEESESEVDAKPDGVLGLGYKSVAQSKAANPVENAYN